MIEFFHGLFSRDFMPHGMCYLWDPTLVWLNVISDAHAGKTIPLVQILRAISLEYWLRDLAGRGLLDAPAASSSLARQHELQVTA